MTFDDAERRAGAVRGDTLEGMASFSQACPISAASSLSPPSCTERHRVRQQLHPGESVPAKSVDEHVPHA